MKGSLVVGIENLTGNKLSGSGQIVIDATGSDGSQTLVGKVTRKLSIREGKQVLLSVPVSPVTLASGTYTLLPTLTAGTESAFGTSGPTLTVDPAVVSLAIAAGTPRPAVIPYGKFGSVSVTITNTGNIEATGVLEITLVPSADGTTAVSGVTLATLDPRVSLKPGRTGRYTLHFKVPESLAPGSYDPFVSLVFDGVSTSSAGSVPFTVG